MAPKKKNPAQLVKQLTQSETAPHSILVISPDSIRAQKVIDRFTSTFFGGPLDSDIVRSLMTRLDASSMNEADFAKLEESMSSLSLFASTTLFLLTNVNAFNAKQTDKLFDILDRASNSSMLILVASSLPSNSRLRKRFATCDHLVELEALKGHAITRWIERELEVAGSASFEKAIPQRIAELSDGSADKAIQIIEQLVLFAGTEPVTLAMARELFFDTPDPNEFELIDLLARGDTLKAELIMYELIEAGKSPFPLLGLLARSYSNLTAIKEALAAGQSATELQRSMSMSPWVYKKNLEAAQRYPLSKLKQSASVILRFDSILKNKSLGPHAIVSDLVHSLAA